MTNGNGTPPEAAQAPSSTCWRSTPRTFRSKTLTRELAPAAGPAAPDQHPDQRQRQQSQRTGVRGDAVGRGQGRDRGKVMFSFELAYAGVFPDRQRAEGEFASLVMIECPRLLFPFAREIIATAVRDGGFPPLMLDPGRLRRSLPSEHGAANGRRWPGRPGLTSRPNRPERRLERAGTRSRSPCRRAWR